MKITHASWIAASMGVLASGAFAQEPKEGEEDKPRLEDTNPLQMESDPHDELQELFAEVERRLLKIDSLLTDASAGDTDALAEVKESGIDELLREAERSQSPSSGGVAGMLQLSEGEGREVLSGIDRIIEIAQQSGST